MNPFTQSTVARPVPEQHPDRDWSRPSCVRGDNNHDNTDSHEDGAGSAQRRNSASLAGSGTCPRVRRTTGRTATMRARKARGSVALTLCLTCSSLIGGAMLKPAPLAGAVALAAALMPRPAAAIDLNVATVQQLQEIKGIGPKTATMIVEERERGGNFVSISDLSDRVRGIGPKKAASLEAAGLKITAAAAGTASATAATGGRAGRSARR